MLAHLNAFPIDDSELDSERSFDGDERLAPLARTFDGDSTLDVRLRLLIEPVPAIVWTTDRELRFTSGLGGGHASFGLRATPGTSLFDHYGTREPRRHPRPPARARRRVGELRARLGGAHLPDPRRAAARRSTGEIIGCVGIAVDITERKHAEEALYREKERAQVTLASIGDGVIRTDAEGQIDYLNPVAERLTGWTAEEAIGRTGPRGLPGGRRDHPPAAGRSGRPLPGGEAGGRVPRPRRCCSAGDGKEYSVRDSVAPIYDRSGGALGAVLVFKDVTQLRGMEREMVYLASHDALTGLINRREFEVRLKRAIRGARGERPPPRAALPRPRRVQGGQRHLRPPGRRRDAQADHRPPALPRAPQRRPRPAGRRRVRRPPGGLPARPGAADRRGDAPHRPRVPLLLARADLRGRGLASASCRSTPTAATSPTSSAPPTPPATWPRTAGATGSTSTRSTTRWSPSATARCSGSTASTAPSRTSASASSTSSSSRSAAEDGARDLLCEVFIRMLDRSGKVIEPSAFIAAAERYHLIDLDRPLGGEDRLLAPSPRRSGASGRARSSSPSTSPASRSARRTSSPSSSRSSRRASVDSRRICFEITETAAISKLDSAIRFISALKAKGCRFILDDFGSGLSSFAYLRDLQVDFLKIDGEFVQNMMEDRVKRAMVESINQIGHVMGLQTIAEWVENRQTLDALKEMGVDYAQGYWLCMPAAAGARRLRPFSALKGRHLNSLGFQPQVGDSPEKTSPEGAAPIGALGVTPSGFRLFSGPAHLGLKPQAIQMPPLRGGTRSFLRLHPARTRSLHRLVDSALVLLEVVGEHVGQPGRLGVVVGRRSARSRGGGGACPAPLRYGSARRGRRSDRSRSRRCRARRSARRSPCGG